MAFLLFLPLCLLGQLPATKAFHLSAVRLLDGPFKRAQETDKKYMLALNVDRLLAPYLVEAGLQPKAKPYGNWEGTGLGGHIGGHYLSALAINYAGTANNECKQRMLYMISELKTANSSLLRVDSGDERPSVLNTLTVSVED